MEGRASETYRALNRSRITGRAESSIVELRLTFGWGTGWVQQSLIGLPGFMREKFSMCVQGAHLSGGAINRVLKCCNLNGCGRGKKAWRFFRAKHEGELWQLDINGGPLMVQGKKYWFLICLGDYSGRYLLLCERYVQPRANHRGDH